MEVLPLSELPMKDGFKFIAVYFDGSEKVQSVYKDKETGTHRILNETNIIGWKRYHKA